MTNRKSVSTACSENVIRLAVLVVITGTGAFATDGVEIGNRPELFVDDTLIAETTGDVAQRLVLPEPREVVLVTDQPWEGNTSGYFTVFQDGDLYRMVYRGWQHDAQKKPVHRETTCYAESRDGIHWTKPSLGLLKWNGSSDNNIIWLGEGTHNFTAFRDDNLSIARLSALATNPGQTSHHSWRVRFAEPGVLGCGTPGVSSLLAVLRQWCPRDPDGHLAGLPHLDQRSRPDV